MLALPMVSRVAAEEAIDVVIVGAGAAGIAATRDLTARGLRVVVLEARQRIGGRALTDRATLGQPFDIGAHWLHNADANPLVEEARARGLALALSDPADVRLFDRASPLPEADHENLQRAAARIDRRSVWPSLFGDDRPMSALASPGDAWEKVALAVPMIEMGSEAEDISFHDYISLASGEDKVVDGGFGGLISALGADIDVRLSAAVTAIHWQEGGGVKVDGAFGSIRARAVIVTVPTSILAGGSIRFKPDLPIEVQTAFADLPMCAFEKIGFRLDRARPDLPEYAIVPKLLAEGRTHSLHMSPDRAVATVMVVGDTARALADEGRKARIAFGRQVLAEVMGSDVKVDASLTTNWLGDPLALGAYSHARIGASRAREVYDSALADRLWFAGEAASGPLAVTVGGAWLSGQRQASAVARQLGV